MDFVGRQEYLDKLQVALSHAREGRGSFVWMRGRRRIGKSRLVEEFVSRSGLPNVFFQTPKGRHRESLREFTGAIGRSTLASAPDAANLSPENWQGALQLAAAGATAERPAVIVIDEFPYLNDEENGVEADFQHAWDRVLERSHVLLICIGSDISMMDRLLKPDRPLHGRPTLQITLPGLSVSEVAELTGLEIAEAIDAYLVVGGFPVLAREWRAASMAREDFLGAQLSDSSQMLVVNGERIVEAEFPAGTHARAVLESIGSGRRTYTTILEDSGVSKSSMDRSMALLQEKRVVEKVMPTSVPPRRESHYGVADPHLRFWLRFIGPYVGELDRGRSDLTLDRIERGWQSFRGISVEPVLRAALSRLLPEHRYGGALDVGSFWSRAGDTEIDLVGVDAYDKPSQIGFAGSIKWRERAPFDRRDAAHLAVQRSRLPGANDDTPMLAISRSGFDGDLVDFQLIPEDLFT